MPEETMHNIVERIKSRRRELNFSFQNLADLTGMSKSTLQRYETGGIKNIPLDKLKTLAKALEVSPEWIMGWNLPASIKSDQSINSSQAIMMYPPKYLDEDTVRKVLELYEDEETRVLLDIKRDLKKEDLDYIIGLVKRLKKEN